MRVVAARRIAERDCGCLTVGRRNNQANVELLTCGVKEIPEISSTTREALGLKDLEWVREALRGPATRTWWGRASDGALVRVTGVCCPGMEGGGSADVESAFADAVGVWGTDASPPLAAETTAEGRVVALCRVAEGAGTLADRLQEAVLEPEDALDCVMQLAERLTSWHERGLSHGYLRPETVLWQEGRVALLEPRLHAAAADAYWRQGASLVADPYAAPESDRFAADAMAADVFALGTLLIHMLVGRPPRLSSSGGLEGTPVYEALPGPLQRTVAAALHPDPTQRLPGAQKLGLYLRVHRMWAAAWDWAPLAALASTPTEPGSAAAVPQHAAMPAAECLASPEAAQAIASAALDGSPAPSEPGEPAGSHGANARDEPHPEHPLPAASPPTPPASADVADAPVPGVPLADAWPVAAAPPASNTTPEPSAAEAEAAPRVTSDVGTETEWPAWLPRPRLEIVGEVAEAAEIAAPQHPGAPAVTPVPVEAIEIEQVSVMDIEPVEAIEIEQVSVMDIEPVEAIEIEPVEEVEIEQATSPAPPLWAAGDWGRDAALPVPYEGALPSSTTAPSADVEEPSRESAIPAGMQAWSGALSPPGVEEPERNPSHLAVDIHTGRQQERIILEGERAAVGRPDPARDHYPEIDLRGDDAISRRHAEFRRGPAGWMLIDLGSTNGTRLNGEWLEPHQEALLRDGDQIEMGAVTTLRVHFGQG
jgi:FHA domain